jgi:hypothetical protein
LNSSSGTHVVVLVAIVEIPACFSKIWKLNLKVA